jgi:hypothetical protein
VLVPAVRTPEPKPEPPAAEAGDGGLKPQLA